MMQPVTFVEIHSPDMAATRTFMQTTFGWDPQPFGTPEYLMNEHANAPGIDTGLMASQDGDPHATPVIAVPDLDAAMADVVRNGGAIVYPRFVKGAAGGACYVVDPAGILIGLHEMQPAATETADDGGTEERLGFA